MTKTFTDGRSAVPTRRRVRLRRLAVLVGSAVVALVVWAVCVPVAGIDLTVGSGSGVQTVGAVSVVLVPLVAGGAAWALLALFERLLTHATRVWRIVGWAVLALSLLGPLSMSHSSAALVTLLLLHLLVGGILIIGLPSPRRRGARTVAP